MNEKELEQKQALVEKILMDTVSAFQKSLKKLQDIKKIQTIDDIQPLVSASSMAFLMHMTHHLLETMNVKMKIDFLNFMKSQCNKGFDTLISEVKKVH